MSFSLHPQQVEVRRAEEDGYKFEETLMFHDIKCQEKKSFYITSPVRACQRYVEKFLRYIS